MSTTLSEARPAPPAEAAPTPARVRFVALDALRGITVLLMLLVNNTMMGEFTPLALQHAPWGGISLADVVFPWFLYCAGAAIPFAYSSARRRGGNYGDWANKAVGRAVVLLALGMFVTSAVSHALVIGLGVLQLIGLAYLVAALLYPLKPTWKALVAVALLVAYWAVIRFLPVPGSGRGVFQESKNAILYVNGFLEPWHLRGLPSVAPAAALAIIATAVIDYLRAGTAARRWAGLVAIGAALTLLGWLWSKDVAFTKEVWSPSYILFGAGTGTMALGVLTLVLDTWGLAPYAFPLLVPGSNALAAYVLPILGKEWVLQDWRVTGGAHPQSIQDALLAGARHSFGRPEGGWAYTVIFIAAWWLLLYALYKRGLFLRV